VAQALEIKAKAVYRRIFENLHYRSLVASYI
jgi:hypothetical protein